MSQVIEAGDSIERPVPPATKDSVVQFAKPGLSPVAYLGQEHLDGKYGHISGKVHGINFARHPRPHGFWMGRIVEVNGES